MDYSEEQKINSPFVLIVYAISAIMAMVGAGMGLYQSFTAGEYIYSLVAVLVSIMAVEVLVFYLIFRTTLETGVSKEGFIFKYFPFVRTEKTISFNEITVWSLRTVKTIREFGGYGFRRKILKKKTAFVMGPGDVLEMHLVNGKTYIFSTENAYMLSSAMKKYAAEKESTNG